MAVKNNLFSEYSQAINALEKSEIIKKDNYFFTSGKFTWLFWVSGNNAFGVSSNTGSMLCVILNKQQNQWNMKDYFIINKE